MFNDLYKIFSGRIKWNRYFKRQGLESVNSCICDRNKRDRNHYCQMVWNLSYWNVQLRLNKFSKYRPEKLHDRRWKLNQAYSPDIWRKDSCRNYKIKDIKLKIFPYLLTSSENLNRRQRKIKLCGILLIFIRLIFPGRICMKKIHRTAEAYK